MDYKIGYLKNIKVEDGMFPNERTVTVKPYEGNAVSGFFHKNLIVPGKGLEIYLLGSDEKSVLIKPRGGEFKESNTIVVPKESLTE
ncbi:MAG: hypothetical protein PVJ67_04715 [Candidatus Pacearchaeota archaeon]|jgi:hypothetical protein